MGHNSQTSLTLGRRPRAVTSSRGPQAFTMTTVWTTTIRAAPTTTWSVLLSVSAKRDMSMVNQRIVVKHAVALINILVPAQIKLEVAENHVEENTLRVNVKVDMNGVDHIVKRKAVISKNVI